MAAIDLTAAVTPEVRAKAMAEAERLRDQGPEHQRLRKATRDMETWFVSTLLKKMHESATKGGLFDQNPESATYREMLDDEIAKQVGGRGAFGIADVLYRDLATHVNETKK